MRETLTRGDMRDSALRLERPIERMRCVLTARFVLIGVSLFVALVALRYAG